MYCPNLECGLDIGSLGYCPECDIDYGCDSSRPKKVCGGLCTHPCKLCREQADIAAANMHGGYDDE